MFYDDTIYKNMDETVPFRDKHHEPCHLRVCTALFLLPSLFLP